MRQRQPAYRRALAGALALGIVAAVLTPGAAAIAEESTTGIVAQSVSVKEWPSVTLRLVLPANLLAAPLRSSDFAVRENGSLVTSVTALALESHRRPLEVILLTDVSGSMRGAPLDAAKAAAKSFVAALEPQDRVSVMRFSDHPSVNATFTGDRAVLGSAIDALAAGGATSLYDALTVAAQSFAPGDDVDRAILLLSDGGDTSSGNTLATATRALTGASVHVYAVALTSPDHRIGPLASVARTTGGRLVEVRDSAGLTAAFGEIARQLTRPYEVTFTSARPPAKDLEIDVVVTGRDGRASVSAVVANPDAGAAMPISLSDAVDLPAAGWPLGIAIAVFAAVAAFAFAIAALMRPEPNAIGQLKYYEQLRRKGSSRADAGDYVDPRSVRGRLVAMMGTVTAHGGFDAAIRRELERAGLPLRPAEYMTFHAAVVLILGLAVQFILGNVALTAFAIALLAFGPILALSALAQRRADAFQAQLPDVLNMLSGSMRAGWGLLQAAGMVVTEMGAPAGPEFERVVTEARLGLPLEQALDKMAERMGSEDFKWAVTAISIQREVGGNLAEVLDMVAETVRERADLKRQVKTLSAEGRLSAGILIALPFVEAIALWMMKPTYFDQLFASPIGVGAAVGALVLMFVGVVWLLAVIRIEV